jgi:biopolymer transport protein ExbD
MPWLLLLGLRFQSEREHDRAQEQHDPPHGFPLSAGRSASFLPSQPALTTTRLTYNLETVLQGIGANGVPSWKPSFRFTIRGVLLLTLVVAVVLAVWRCRPSPWLAVDVTSRGTVLVQDKDVPVAELPAVFSRESARRKFWWMRGGLAIRADPDTPYQDLVELFDVASASGFDQITLTATDP